MRNRLSQREANQVYTRVILAAQAEDDGIHRELLDESKRLMANARECTIDMLHELTLVRLGVTIGEDYMWAAIQDMIVRGLVRWVRYQNGGDKLYWIGD